MVTQAQVNTALRYSGVSSATVGSVLVFLGLLPPETAHKLVDAFQKLMVDLQPVIGDFYYIAGLIGPTLALYLAKKGWNSASPKNQIASVQAMPQAQVTVTDPKLAEGIPGVQVKPEGQ